MLTRRHKKAVGELSWNIQHVIQWGETTILDQVSTKKLKIKEALNIFMTPFDHCSASTGIRAGDSRLLDGDSEADGKSVKLHLWP